LSIEQLDDLKAHFSRHVQLRDIIEDVRSDGLDVHYEALLKHRKKEFGLNCVPSKQMYHTLN